MPKNERTFKLIEDLGNLVASRILTIFPSLDKKKLNQIAKDALVLLIFAATSSLIPKASEDQEEEEMSSLGNFNTVISNQDSIAEPIQELALNLREELPPVEFQSQDVLLSKGQTNSFNFSREMTNAEDLENFKIIPNQEELENSMSINKEIFRSSSIKSELLKESSEKWTF